MIDQSDAERQPLLQHDTSAEAVAQLHQNGLDKPNDDGQKDSNLYDSNGEGDSWQVEVRTVIRYSIPLIGTYLLQYFYSIVIVLVASRLSTRELAGVSLGITTSNIVGYAVFEGMSTALDTLCSQAYGASQPKLVGLHCARFVVYIHLVAAPIALLWAFSPQLLRWILPEADLAVSAGTFLRYSLVGVPGYASFEVGKRFMQAQGDFTAGLAVLVACLPLSLLFNWLFVFQFPMRVAGAALAASLTHLVRPFLLIGYAVFVKRSSLQCWPSRSQLRRQLFKNWGQMVRLSIPGALMTLSEWFSFEILTFATSYVSTVDLAAQTFLSTIAILLWHLPFSASIACSTRVGRLLGAKSIDKAKSLMSLHGYIFLVIGVISAVLAVVLNIGVTKYLLEDELVKSAVAHASLFTALFCFFDSTSSWVHGIIRGLGWQKIGGWITLCVNYGFGVPLALGLLLGHTGVGVGSIYLGLGLGLGIMTVIEALIVRARPWESVVMESEEPEG
ncbi:MATE efflux family protein [Polychaeton citri CBS 116435]|uniref:MATE efflux family protein n=1 Tax=Polychaeton citri CBS 116435 TaxID=1314669 RepID=A0A9P4PZ17_9PEZI|nr:MATE efflux family protein [Polychaeton citri CBS 116435]